MARTRRPAAPPPAPPGPRYIFTEAPLRIKNPKLADPQALGEAIEEVRQSHNGVFNPRDGVAAARDPANALHPHLEWDDEIAAEEHRTDQVRAIVRTIRIDRPGEYPDLEAPRAFISIHDPRDGVGYYALRDLRNNLRLQLSLLQSAERDLLAWQRRYSEIRDICPLIEAARQRLFSRRRELENDENDGARAN